MSDCGHLSGARALRREVTTARDALAASSLAAELATWRARTGFTADTLVYLLGIGPETCERIERGEIVPEPELAERIGQVIHSHSDAPRPRCASVSPASAARSASAGNEGGAAVFPLLTAAPPVVAAEDFGLRIPIPPPSPALAKADDGSFHVEMFLGRHCLLEMDVDEAGQLAAELQALVALTRDPHLYENQPRLARPDFPKES